MTTENVVDIRDLRVSFATDAGTVRAVEGVTLQVAAGEVLAIVGESGSGKTVTARSLLGLLPETALTSGVVLLTRKDGSATHDIVTLRGSDLRDVRGRDAAMVFQEPSTALNPVFPVGWQIAEGLRAHGRLSDKDARARAIDVLRLVGIPDPEHRVDHYPHQFSGGQKQRIVIAQALVLDPGLIIADEPTTALDVTVQAEILDLLRRLPQEFGSAIVLITHNMGVVADLADRVAVMYEGEIVEQADVRTLFSSPQHPYTRRLLDAVPRVGGSRLRDRARAVGELEAMVVDESATPVVEAKELRVVYPGRLRQPAFTAVDGVDLVIRPGEVLGLVGESGSGKTTIGRAIAGLTSISGGSLKVHGVEMLDVKEKVFRPVRKRIGFVFQDPATSFNPLLTIAQCVAEPMVVHGLAPNPVEARPRVDELLEAVQLPRAFGDRFPHELSGGQRQRASLARALILGPELLVADEPTSALDVSVQARVLDLFARLQAELGFACLFISHDLAVVDLLAHRIAVLHRGVLVEEGTGDEVLGAPKHPYTQRLLASLPVPDPVEQAARREAWRSLRT
ncbi:ABC transporter ATP-binding protein [Cellulomonas fengjieae]|uniref:ABC transporter ATP-binding protein n=1 Tax=Cellulomonas fengjieae TaxID=2819978 RepID=A0ABS3SC40_9CELL|nr:ABC transporter ATP-binding protein [Cellulomonas fengjieae]MBO3083319.1 ABC transporter ATP-binding protein [Cellulomonas fengjieae]MBO3101933.1 ABC transporter ATP-binding protein [Cellulomonas fengjieae]QVI65333.1 ABC transporter ATP-binding protein [Cellulomonas fengjieae]